MHSKGPFAQVLLELSIAKLGRSRNQFSRRLSIRPNQQGPGGNRPQSGAPRLRLEETATLRSSGAHPEQPAFQWVDRTLARASLPGLDVPAGPFATLLRFLESPPAHDAIGQLRVQACFGQICEEF